MYSYSRAGLAAAKFDRKVKLSASGNEVLQQSMFSLKLSAHVYSVCLLVHGNAY